MIFALSQAHESPILSDIFFSESKTFEERRPNIIRLNAEVQANVKIKEGINKDTSDYFPNCGDVESIEISENEYLNCGCF
jgi:hypothetical protein